VTITDYRPLQYTTTPQTKGFHSSVTDETMRLRKVLSASVDKKSCLLEELFTKKNSFAAERNLFVIPGPTHAEYHMSASQAVKSTVREKGNAYIHLCYTRKVLN
jgi:hypothetical protein